MDDNKVMTEQDVADKEIETGVIGLVAAILAFFLGCFGINVNLD